MPLEALAKRRGLTDAQKRRAAKIKEVIASWQADIKHAKFNIRNANDAIRSLRAELKALRR